MENNLFLLGFSSSYKVLFLQCPRNVSYSCVFIYHLKSPSNITLNRLLLCFNIVCHFLKSEHLELMSQFFAIPTHFYDILGHSAMLILAIRTLGFWAQFRGYWGHTWQLLGMGVGARNKNSRNQDLSLKWKDLHCTVWTILWTLEYLICTLLVQYFWVTLWSAWDLISEVVLSILEQTSICSWQHAKAAL